MHEQLRDCVLFSTHVHVAVNGKVLWFLENQTLNIVHLVTGVIELQGHVQEFVVNVTTRLPHEDDVLTMTVAATESARVIDGLAPSRTYDVTVTTVTHGGWRITSDVVSVTTSDGGLQRFMSGIHVHEGKMNHVQTCNIHVCECIVLAGDLNAHLHLHVETFCFVASAPVGLDAPRVTVVDPSALRISWSAPQQPNGRITGYYVYLNEERINIETTMAGSYVLRRLQPFTVYAIQVHMQHYFFGKESTNV